MNKKHQEKLVQTISYNRASNPQFILKCLNSREDSDSTQVHSSYSLLVHSLDPLADLSCPFFDFSASH